MSKAKESALPLVETPRHLRCDAERICHGSLTRVSVSASQGVVAICTGLPVVMPVTLKTVMPETTMHQQKLLGFFLAAAITAIDIAYGSCGGPDTAAPTSARVPRKRHTCIDGQRLLRIPTGLELAGEQEQPSKQAAKWGQKAPRLRHGITSRNSASGFA